MGKLPSWLLALFAALSGAGLVIFCLAQHQNNIKSPNDPSSTHQDPSLTHQDPLSPHQDQCFCQLKGHVDDCSCDVNTVDYFNNHKIYPRLRSLLDKDFFRYFEYNPNKKCLFFDEARLSADKCASPSCGVQECSKSELPPGLAHPEVSADCSEEDDNGSAVDDSLSEEAIRDLRDWKDHDDSQVGGFCEVDGANSDKPCPDCVHVDLTKNPERYTGYSGEAAHKVWRTIYQENCFRPASGATATTPTTQRSPFHGSLGDGRKKKRRKEDKTGGSATQMLKEYFVPQEQLAELCLEKRAFYRAISGLHTSITIHLTSRFPKKLMKDSAETGSTRQQPKLAAQPSSLFGGPGGSKGSSDDEYGPNLDMFLSRFDPEATQGQGPFWLRNLYFVYLMELRALLKAKPFLLKQTFYTGNPEVDGDTRTAVAELLNVISGFSDHYDESVLFPPGSPSATGLMNEFREHFLNISRVMDCVSCDKCKLWGKLQTTGLGTALKILFSGDATRIKLSRNEVVALFNAFGRISTSIQQLENFREQLRSQQQSQAKKSFGKFEL